MNEICNNNINENIDDILYLSLACCRVTNLPFDIPKYDEEFYYFINNACPKFNISLLHKGQKEDQ